MNVRTKLMVAAVACGVGFTTLEPSVAHAGWRELGLVVIPMHPKDDSTARRCYTQIRKALVGEEGSDVVHSRASRDTLVRKLGAETVGAWRSAPDDAFDPLETWEPRVWRGPDGKTINGSGWTVDAIVMIDCRPDAKTVDVVSVGPAGNSVLRVRLAHREVDKSVRTLVTGLVTAHAWADFSP